MKVDDGGRLQECKLSHEKVQYVLNIYYSECTNHMVMVLFRTYSMNASAAHLVIQRGHSFDTIALLTRIRRIATNRLFIDVNEYQQIYAPNCNELSIHRHQTNINEFIRNRDTHSSTDHRPLCLTHNSERSALRI